MLDPRLHGSGRHSHHVPTNPKATWSTIGDTHSGLGRQWSFSQFHIPQTGVEVRAAHLSFFGNTIRLGNGHRIWVPEKCETGCQNG